MPHVILVRVHDALGRHHMKRSDADIAKRFDRPTVVPIGLSEPLGKVLPDPVLLQQRPDIYASRHCVLERADSLPQANPRCCPNRRVLLAHQFECFRRPGHDLAVEAHPVRLELIPEPTPLQSTLNGCEELAFQRQVLEKPTARPRVADTFLVFEDSKSLAWDILAPAHNKDGARPHVLLLDDDRGYAARPVVRECFGRMLEQAIPLCRLAGRHRRRQVDQPLRICREAAHHLEGSGGVLLSNCDAPVQPGRDEPFASHIVYVEEIIIGLLRVQSRCWGCRQERPNGIGVGGEGCHRHQFLLRPAQGSQPAAEHATGIDIDRAVEPLGLRNGRVSVDDARTASILRCPVVANGQAELVRLSGCLTEKCEIPHFG